jgi:uncharacterized RDD family membrane protein YckC
MKRQEFIEEIREALAGILSKEEIDEIAYDYNEYFDAGLCEGRSEAEISTELGSPARVVRAILAEKTGRHAPSGLGIRENQALANGDQAATPDPAAPFGSPEYASLGERLLAYMIDAVIAGLPIALLGLTYLALLMAFMPGAAYLYALPESSRPPVLLSRACVAFYVLYFPLCLYFLKGRTIGKMVMGLRVVRRDGSPLRGTDVLSREVLGRMMLASITFGISNLVSLAWALLTREHQTVHDGIAGTRVIKIRGSR